MLTDATLRGEAPPASVGGAAAAEAAGAAMAPAVAAAEAEAEAADGAGFYGAGRAALEESMAALQRQAMPDEAWKLVYDMLHAHRLGAQAPASGGASSGEKGEL